MSPVLPLKTHAARTVFEPPLQAPRQGQAAGPEHVLARNWGLVLPTPPPVALSHMVAKEKGKEKQAQKKKSK